MEYENKYASKGIGGTALGLSIGALGAELLGGGLGNLFGGRNADGATVSRYELELQSEIESKNSKIALLESNIYVDSKLSDVYERLSTRIAGIENQLCEQRVYNATNTSAIACLQGQVAQLANLTKTVIPIDNVCPTPMPQFNSFTMPTTG